MTSKNDDMLYALLELAAADDVERLRTALAGDAVCLADCAGLWYGRSKSLELRTPLMVAATYGSVAAIAFLLGLPAGAVDANRSSGHDGATALHCAASGGAPRAAAAVKLLLAAGANPAAADASGRRSADVIAVPPASADARTALEMLLGSSGDRRQLQSSTAESSTSSSPPLSSSPEVGIGGSASSGSSSPDRKKEYPVDPTLPDIKSSIYATDEFRMFAFKVRPCSRAYSHDWTECPFVHPGENARRRDPRKHPYSSLPCPDFRKPGGCPRLDACEYAHGVFESWLHPAQYRTRICKEGEACTRRVCFFAHRREEVRRPQDSAAGLVILPASPTAGHFTPPMSPSTDTYWMQGSRLRSSLNARNMPMPNDDLTMVMDMEAQSLGALCLSPRHAQPRLCSVYGMNRSVRPKPLAPSNVEDGLASEVAMSPRFVNDQGGAVFSPTHKSAILNQLQQQQQQQRLLSPIDTGRLYSPKALDPSALMHAAGPVGGMSPRSPKGMEPASPLSVRLANTIAQREKLEQQLRAQNRGAPQPLVRSPGNSNSYWGNLGLPMGKVDWGVDGEELGRLRRPEPFELAVDEPDVSWVQSLVNPPEVNGKKHEVGGIAGMATGLVNRQEASNQADVMDHTVIGAWLEQMQIDQK